jgi:hypothetical protein
VTRTRPGAGARRRGGALRQRTVRATVHPVDPSRRRKRSRSPAAGKTSRTAVAPPADRGRAGRHSVHRLPSPIPCRPARARPVPPSAAPVRRPTLSSFGIHDEEVSPLRRRRHRPGGRHRHRQKYEKESHPGGTGHRQVRLEEAPTMRWSRIRRLWPIRRRLLESETRIHASCQVRVRVVRHGRHRGSAPRYGFSSAASRCGDGIGAFANCRPRSRTAAFRGPPSEIGY